MAKPSRNRMTLIVGFPPGGPSLDVAALIPPGRATKEQLDARVAETFIKGWRDVVVFTLTRDGSKLRVHRPDFDPRVQWRSRPPALTAEDLPND
jgi:hypothetical protein